MAGGLVEYNPNTGVFKWVESYANRVKVGALAGHVRPDGYRVLPCGTRAHVAACALMGIIVPEGGLVDHINGDITDNRIDNLRVANKKINAHNTGVRKTNTTGHRGVSWDAARSKYRAALVVDGKQYSKRFENQDDAVSWYTYMATQYGVLQYQR